MKKKDLMQQIGEFGVAEVSKWKEGSGDDVRAEETAKAAIAAKFGLPA